MPKPCTRSYANGFSLIELMIALAISLFVLSAGLTLAVGTRRIYDADASRVRVNQSLRAGMDLLSADIRQAGERLGDDFPALEIENDSDEEPDSEVDDLTLRRNLIRTVLRPCRDVKKNDGEIYIGEPDHAPPPGCDAVPDDDGDGWPENLQAWHEWRLQQGGPVRAYIWDPIDRVGEFFTWVGEDRDELTLEIGGATDLSRDYDVDHQTRIYILEERQYDLEGDLLRVRLNDDDAAEIHLVDGLTDFRVRAVLQDGTVLESFSVDDIWSDLEAIEIDLRARDERRAGTIDRTWTGRFAPRNVLSR